MERSTAPFLAPGVVSPNVSLLAVLGVNFRRVKNGRPGVFLRRGLGTYLQQARVGRVSLERVYFAGWIG